MLVRNLLVFLGLFIAGLSLAQEPILYDKNNILWLGGFLNLDLNKTWFVQAEYQERRNDCGKTNLQHLSKASLGYVLDPRLKLRLGYAYAQTFAYGLYPLRLNESQFGEHRSFQSLSLDDEIKGLSLQHRFILEQRWLLRRGLEPQFLNRFRYALRVEFFLNKKKAKDLTWSLALNQEILLGFGRQLGVNIFDQNRLNFVLVARWRGGTRWELAYLRQVLVLGRRVEGQRVMQFNRGLSLSFYQNFSLHRDFVVKRGQF